MLTGDVFCTKARGIIHPHLMHRLQEQARPKSSTEVDYHLLLHAVKWLQPVGSFSPLMGKALVWELLQMCHVPL